MAIAENITELNRLHQQGERLQKRWAKAKREKRLEELVIAENLTMNVARKSIQFSRSYNEDQLRDLLRSLKNHDNQTFGIAHVIQLMAVTDLKKRRRFQQQAIHSAWTSRALGTAIRTSHGGQPSRPSGRKHRVESEHPLKELQKLNDRAESTRKHLASVQQAIEEWINNPDWYRADGTDFATAKKMLKLTESAVKSLEKSAEKVLFQLKSLARKSARN